MDSNKVFQHFKERLDDACENSPYFAQYLANPYSSEYDLDFSCGLSIFTGATRATIVDDDYDYVVKIDIDTDGSGENVCARELEIYNDAFNAGLGRCFAETQCLGLYTKKVWWYPDIDLQDMADEQDFLDLIYGEGYESKKITISFWLYGYEKADCERWEGCRSTPEERDFVSRQDSPLSERSTDVACALLHQYGVETFIDLGNFCRDHHVNDLHTGNVGYVDDRLVLIDFGGYWR